MASRITGNGQWFAILTLAPGYNKGHKYYFYRTKQAATRKIKKLMKSVPKIKSQWHPTIELTEVWMDYPESNEEHLYTLHYADGSWDVD